MSDNAEESPQRSRWRATAWGGALVLAAWGGLTAGLFYGLDREPAGQPGGRVPAPLPRLGAGSDPPRSPEQPGVAHPDLVGLHLGRWRSPLDDAPPAPDAPLRWMVVRDDETGRRLTLLHVDLSRLRAGILPAAADVQAYPEVARRLLGDPDGPVATVDLGEAVWTRLGDLATGRRDEAHPWLALAGESLRIASRAPGQGAVVSGIQGSWPEDGEAFVAVATDGGSYGLIAHSVGVSVAGVVALLERLGASPVAVFGGVSPDRPGYFYRAHAPGGAADGDGTRWRRAIAEKSLLHATRGVVLDRPKLVFH